MTDTSNPRTMEAGISHASALQALQRLVHSGLLGVQGHMQRREIAKQKAFRKDRKAQHLRKS